MNYVQRRNYVQYVGKFLYRQAESYVSQHQTSKLQSTRLGSVPQFKQLSKQPF